MPVVDPDRRYLVDKAVFSELQGDLFGGAFLAFPDDSGRSRADLGIVAEVDDRRPSGSLVILAAPYIVREQPVRARRATQIPVGMMARRI